MDLRKNQRTNLFGDRSDDLQRGDIRHGYDASSSEVPPNEDVHSGFTPVKTLIVFAVIFGCFAVIYPRFIHPVVKYAYYGQQSQDKIAEEKFLPPKFQQGAIHPEITTRPVPRSNMQDRPTHHPGSRFTGDHGYVPESKGSLYIMLPLYTVGIIAFLLYTFYKVLSSNNNPCFMKPVQPKNVRYSPTRQQFTDKVPMEAELNRIDTLLSQQQEKDGLSDNDTKITEYQLKALEAKLKETEAQMNELIAQMVVVKSVDELVKKAELAVESDEPEEEEDFQEEEEGPESDRLAPELSAEEEKEALVDQQFSDEKSDLVEPNWDSDVEGDDQELPQESAPNNENDDPEFRAYSFLTAKPTKKENAN